MSLPTVASLWIGGHLSYLEQVCLKSFVDHGHRTVLYTYGTVTGVPDGVEVLDANTVFPNTNFIRHKKSGSPAIHADAFRYKMIESEDVIWIDADILCVRPWDMPRPYVFGWEKPGKLVCNAVLGLRPEAKTLALLNELCSDEYPIPPWASDEEMARLKAAKAAGEPAHVSELSWGVWGPAALTFFLFQTGEMKHVLPQEAFYPISFKDRRDLLAPGRDLSDRIGDGCYGVHLWNRRLRRRLVTHGDGTPAPGSWLADALVKHGVDPKAAPIPDEPPKGAEPAKQKSSYLSPVAVADVPRGRAKAEVERNPQSELAARNTQKLEAHTGRLLGWLPPAKEKPKSDRVLIVTGMKNEAPFILEWVAYHRAIGVTDFLVYTNDCTDNTNAILDRLAEHGYVLRLDNPWKKGKAQKPQHAALKDAITQPIFEEADWVLTIDVDEFINIHVGDGTLKAFFEAANHPNVVSFTWKFFGNGGVHGYEDRPIIEQFVRCAPEVIPKPRLGWGFKSMFHKSSPYTALGVHRPMKPDETRLDEVRWVNGSGKVMPPSALLRGWRSTTQSLGYELATLNHYVLRSAESYLVKRERGRINHTDQDQGFYYWSRRNYSTEIDQRIHARLPAMEAVRSEMLKDPVLAKLHAEAVAWHSSRIEKLKATPGYDDLFEELCRTDRPDAIHVKKEAAAAASVAAPAETLDYALPNPPRSAVEAVDPRFAHFASHAEENGGFFWQGDQNAVGFIPGDRSLVVSFDSEKTVKTDGDRFPAEFETLNGSLGCSVLGVMGLSRNWFQTPFVYQSLKTLSNGGFFETFDRILLLGSSMGGFGALAHANLVPNAQVLAFSPQSTLDPKRVPWDTRWGWASKLDWSGPQADAAKTQFPASTTIIFDPFDEDDVKHINRLKTREAKLFKAPFMGHGPDRHLSPSDALESCIELALRGELTEERFHKIRRDRRSVPKFQHDLIRICLDRNKPKLARAAAERAIQIQNSKKLKALLAEIESL